MCGIGVPGSALLPVEILRRLKNTIYLCLAPLSFHEKLEGILGIA